MRTESVDQFVDVWPVASPSQLAANPGPSQDESCQSRQGRRKLLKVGGGAGFEGHFPNKKGHLKIFSRKSWRRGGGEVSKKFFRTYLKNFSDISHFFLNMKKIFRIHRKIFRIYHIFPGREKIFPKIT